VTYRLLTVKLPVRAQKAVKSLFYIVPQGFFAKRVPKRTNTHEESGMQENAFNFLGLS
jgi:hypothetical protein